MSDSELVEDDTIGQLLKHIHEDEEYMYLGVDSLPTLVKCAPISIIGEKPAEQQSELLREEYNVDGFYGQPLKLLNKAIDEHTEIDRSGVPDEHIPSNDEIRAQSKSVVVGGETIETMVNTVAESQSTFIDSEAH